jgi:hypothetical protein
VPARAVGIQVCVTANVSSLNEKKLPPTVSHVTHVNWSAEGKDPVGQDTQVRVEVSKKKALEHGYWNVTSNDVFWPRIRSKHNARILSLSNIVVYFFSKCGLLLLTTMKGWDKLSSFKLSVAL